MSSRSKKAVAIYARVSRADKGQEVENQVRELRAFCRKQGWRISHVYQDEASGKNGDRPQFKRLFEDVHKRKCDLVLFWALDRFSRAGTRETLNYLQRLTDAGVDWQSYTEPHIKSAGPLGELVIAMLATFAKLERERIRERTLAGIETARRKGKKIGRPHAIFDRDRVLRMHKDGLSIRAIADKLKVSKTTVHRTLKAA
jgi:DNA invertase Pin-like site-specific DNA recombinase